jgi:ferrous-iron efflux pump FieF
MKLGSPKPKAVSAEARGRLMRRASMASVVVALGLIALKAGAWIMTGSVAMLGSLLDSFLDALASAMILLAINHSLIPADEDHRFGHGKAEAIAGLGQATVIFVSSLYVFVEAVQHLMRPEPVREGVIGVVVIVLSMAATLCLVTYQRRVSRLTGSMAISADALHYRSDLYMNAGVIVALVLSSQFGIWFADPIIGIVIAGIITHSAWAIARQSFDTLMDKELPTEDRARIEEIVLSHAEVRGIHDLRTRTSGLHSFIQFHLELDPAMRLEQAHRLSDKVERAVARAFPDADIIIHADPAGVEMPHDVVEDGLGNTP